MKKIIPTISLVALLNGCGYLFSNPQRDVHENAAPEKERAAAPVLDYESFHPTGKAWLNSWFMTEKDTERVIVVRYSCHNLVPERIFAEIDIFPKGTSWKELRSWTERDSETGAPQPVESYQCKGIRRHYRGNGLDEDRFIPRECGGTTSGEGITKQELYDIVTSVPLSVPGRE